MGKADGAFRQVFREIAALNPVYAKATIDTDNLESVFAAFEMKQLFGSVSPTAAAEPLSTDALKDLIVTTLEQRLSIHIEVKEANSVLLEPPQPYGKFLSCLESRGLNRHTFVTFNYDLALDLALRMRERASAIDYGFYPQRFPDQPLLLKLHGSINWTACQACEAIGAYDLHRDLPARFEGGRRLFRPIREPLVESDGGIGLHLSDVLTTFRHCNCQNPSTGKPLLVPPTWSKAEHQKRLESVWRHAAEELATAKNVVVVGYSLPEADHFFRYLYALGTASDTRIERFWVVDLDVSGRLTKRFRALLGQTARARFRHFPWKFGEVLDTDGFIIDRQMGQDAVDFTAFLKTC